MYQTFSQQLANLPKEILSQPRFFQLFGKDKGDTPKGWSDPDNEDEPKMPPTFQPMALLEALAVFLREQLHFSRSML